MLSSQSKGILFALAACFVWGLIFVIPQFMPSQGPFDVALGRNTFYGLLSLTMFARIWNKGSGRFSQVIWRKALFLSLLSTIVYYTCLVFALRHATPAVSALILGTSPITIACYGNWKQKEMAFRELLFPSCLILLGLVAINFPHFGQETSSYLLGIGSSLVSLSAWSFYVVANAEFLKTNPHIRASDWSTLLGVATLSWVLFFLPFYVIFTDSQQLLQLLSLPFWVGCGILGIFCSWVGAFFWNRASVYLPVSFAGQITVFETLFGLLFIYLLAQTFPPLLEIIGMSLILIAILREVRRFSVKNRAEN